MKTCVVEIKDVMSGEHSIQAAFMARANISALSPEEKRAKWVEAKREIERCLGSISGRDVFVCH